MLSLYIHIPFCLRKCNFCSFHVIPEDLADKNSIEVRKELCLQWLIKENEQWKLQLPDTALRTVHIWWWTPFQLWAGRLEKLVDHVLETRDCEHLEELTIELNPDPIPQVIALVAYFQEKYRKLYKLRFSFGIQTLDDKILSKWWRSYTYEELQEFFRTLRTTRKHHGLSYNADFIAFGSQELTKEQWTFFRSVLHAKLFDSMSLYTLELFPGSQRRNESKHLAATNSPLWWDDDAIINEFIDYQEIFEQSGYHRYEISNFSLLWKRSIHNMTYRTHGSYIGIGPSASSFLTWKELTIYKRNNEITDFQIPEDTIWVRWKNTLNRNKWTQWNTYEDIEYLDQSWLDYEKIMLGLRTDHWIKNLPEYSNLLADDYETLLQEWTTQWLCTYTNTTLKLTGVWMSVYNSLLTELIK